MVMIMMMVMMMMMMMMRTFVAERNPLLECNFPFLNVNRIEAIDPSTAITGRLKQIGAGKRHFVMKVSLSLSLSH